MATLLTRCEARIEYDPFLTRRVITAGERHAISAFNAIRAVGHAQHLGRWRIAHGQVSERSVKLDICELARNGKTNPAQYVRGTRHPVSDRFTRRRRLGKILDEGISSECCHGGGILFTQVDKVLGSSFVLPNSSQFQVQFLKLLSIRLRILS